MEKIMIGVLLPILILFISCHNGNKKRTQHGKTRGTLIKTDRISSKVVSNSLHANGLPIKENEVKLSFKSDGIIDMIYVREGEFVKKGQLLANLKFTDVNPAFVNANFSVDKAQDDYVRIKNLFKAGTASFDQLQNAKEVLEIAEKSADTIAFDELYNFIRASANGWVIKKKANEGEAISADAIILILKKQD
jgi:multidrug efflux pump subunit AcrA (membrane-fusion protein)